MGPAREFGSDISRAAAEWGPAREFGSDISRAAVGWALRSASAARCSRDSHSHARAPTEDRRSGPRQVSRQIRALVRPIFDTIRDAEAPVGAEWSARTLGRAVGLAVGRPRSGIRHQASAEARVGTGRADGLLVGRPLYDAVEPGSRVRVGWAPVADFVVPSVVPADVSAPVWPDPRRAAGFGRGEAASAVETNHNPATGPRGSRSHARIARPRIGRARSSTGACRST